jgi:hypothetical protein
MPDLRRLLDLPGVAELENRALMSSRMAEPEARDEHPEIDACLQENFGLTYEQADDARPADWDRPERRPVAEQVLALEDAGWDVTDAKRRPLRMFGHFALPLWLAVRGVAGSLPFTPEPEEPHADWGGGLAADALRFKKDRR